MKDRLGRVAQKAKEVGDQVKEEAVGAREGARAAAQERVDSAKEAVAVKADTAVQRVGSAAGSVKSRFDDFDLESLLNRVPVPASPVTEDWRFSLSNIVTAGERPPKGSGVLLKQLDRFGAIDIGPEKVGFDDTTAKWDKIKAVRTRTLEGMMEQALSETMAEDIAGFLPPVPGRAWAAEKATTVLFTLYALIADIALREPGAGQRQYVCEIEYKGWIRTKEAATGMFTGPCMALIPGLDDLFRAEATRHGITIEAIPSGAIEDAYRRAEWLRAKQAEILGRRKALDEGLENAAEAREAVES